MGRSMRKVLALFAALLHALTRTRCPASARRECADCARMRLEAP